MKIQRFLLRTSFRSYTATTGMLLFSIVIALFCMNVIFGFAESAYRSGSSCVEYTTIAIAGMDSDTKHKDMMTELKKYGPSAALYFCRSNDHAILVGFDGTDVAGNWWPHMAGDFVNNKSSEDYPYVVYLTDFEAEQVPLGSMFDVDGSDYRMIGYGWIVPQNFTRLISKTSPQTVFDQFQKEATYYNDELTDVSRCFRIIPYEAFRESPERNVPEQHGHAAHAEFQWTERKRLADHAALYPAFPDPDADHSRPGDLCALQEAACRTSCLPHLRNAETETEVVYAR